MRSMAVSPARAARTEILALQLLVLVFLAMRLWFQFEGGVLGDEAYYWMWGQHLDWSYFDHPPLHAWLLRIVSLFGWTPFGVRALTWVSLAVVLTVLWSWSKRLAPQQLRLWFWRATAIYLASPVFFVFSSSAYNDHLLVALALAATHCFVVFVEHVEDNRPDATRWLFGAALLAGFGVLTKYNGVFVGIGFAVTFLVRPKLRVLLLTPAPWLAAALAVALQTPVLWWNLVEGGASFRYHLDERWGTAAGGLHWFNAVRFLGMSLLLWSPFLVWPLIRLARTPLPAAFASAAKAVALSTFAASTLILVATSVVLDAYFYWNVVALVSLTPLLAGFTNRWLRLFHFLHGVFWGGLLFVNFSIMPIASLLGMRDYGSAINYDWALVTQHVQARRAEHPDALIAATRYSTTSQLGFALGTTDVVKLSPEHSQWDFWQAGRDFAGRSALILTDEPDGDAAIQFLSDHFEAVAVVDSFDIERFGRRLYSWRILLGTNYRP